jgi:hypothetical protein
LRAVITKLENKLDNLAAVMVCPILERQKKQKISTAGL